VLDHERGRGPVESTMEPGDEMIVYRIITGIVILIIMGVWYLSYLMCQGFNDGHLDWAFWVVSIFYTLAIGWAIFNQWTFEKNSQA
jgi:hypothetical protein